MKDENRVGEQLQFSHSTELETSPFRWSTSFSKNHNHIFSIALRAKSLYNRLQSIYHLLTTHCTPPNSPKFCFFLVLAHCCHRAKESTTSECSTWILTEKGEEEKEEVVTARGDVGKQCPSHCCQRRTRNMQVHWSLSSPKFHNSFPIINILLLFTLFPLI